MCCCFWDWDPCPSIFLLPIAALARLREPTECWLALSQELDWLVAGLCLASVLSCKLRDASVL